ncbi:MAG: NADPH:quinone oxidoreductase family protein [Pseudomonadota bacterium]
MIAFQIEDYGATPAFVERPLPEPKSGEIRVRIAACGLNFADLLTIEGRYQEKPDPPVILGKELAGIVDAVGADVVAFTPGERVAVYSGQGGLAEYGCFPASRCVKIPSSMPLAEAAGFQIAYGTSHLALAHRANLQSGETLLVLGAAGGVGLTAVEIGKAMGAKVIAAARGAERHAIAKAAGAEHLIDTDTEDIRETVRGLGRADVVYDPVGGAAFDAALRAVNPEARIIVIGFASGDVPQVPANIVMVKNVSIIGVNWGGYLSFAPVPLFDSLATLLTWYQAGKLHPVIGHRLPLEQAAEGLALLRQRKATGKIVVDIADLEGNR